MATAAVSVSSNSSNPSVSSASSRSEGSPKSAEPTRKLLDLSPSPFSFPQLPPIKPEDCYVSIINLAKKEYPKYEQYQGVPDELEIIDKTNNVIKGKIEEFHIWANGKLSLKTEQITPEIEAEFQEKVKTYVHYQTIRNDLERIVKVYEDAIEKLKTPTYDMGTLVELVKQGHVSADLGKLHNQIFKTEQSNLVKQLVDFRKLLNSVAEKVNRLKTGPMEQFAAIRKPSWFSLPAVVNKTIVPTFNKGNSRAPYFDAAVVEWKEKSAKVESKPEPTPDSKTA